jgi:hypothetical protein
MRPVLSSAVFVAAMLAAAAAPADLGPPPRCAAGSHDEYDRGHHCVPDSTPAAADGGAAADGAASAPVKDSPPVGTPPADRGCACGIAGGGGFASALVASLALLAALARRTKK